MQKTEFTYGQLDKVLRLLGFTCRIVTDTPQARIYEEKQTGASFTLPAFAFSDNVLDKHLLGVRTSLDLYGIVGPTEFTAKLKKAG